MKYWVIGGEFTSLNFHSFTDNTAVVYGPYDSRADAEEQWKLLSEQYRSRANYRFIITKE